MVDARGFKQHQNKVRSEQGATLSVVKNDPQDISEFRRGFVEGWRAAMDEELAQPYRLDAAA
jgi:hypothetical protein